MDKKVILGAVVTFAVLISETVAITYYSGDVNDAMFGETDGLGRAAISIGLQTKNLGADQFYNNIGAICGADTKCMNEAADNAHASGWFATWL